MSGLMLVLLVGCQTSTTRTDPVEQPPASPGQEGTRGPAQGQESTPEQQAAQEEQGAQEQQAVQGQEPAPQQQPEQERQTARAQEPLQQREQQQEQQHAGRMHEPEHSAAALPEDSERSAEAGHQVASGRAPQDSDERFREAMDRFDRRLDREEFGSTRPTAGGGAEAGGAGAGQQGSAGAEGDREDALAGGGTPFDGPDEQQESGMDQRDPRAAGGLGRRSAEYPVPPDIPDRADDDIVARQLRAAAENEPDPELRARLWDEYRAYKDNQ